MKIAIHFQYSWDILRDNITNFLKIVKANPKQFGSILGGKTILPLFGEQWWNDQKIIFTALNIAKTHVEGLNMNAV